jgi:hypothetical protein
LSEGIALLDKTTMALQWIVELQQDAIKVGLIMEKQILMAAFWQKQ